MAESQIGKFYPVKPRPKILSKKPSSTPESKFWRSFTTHQLSNLIFPITSIEFSPNPPHHIAATYSASLTVYNPQSFAPALRIAKFPDVAYSASFRLDGRLIAAGGESGVVQIFDVNLEKKMENPLRQLRGHGRAVHLVRYSKFDKLHLFSGGDDCVVRYWDVVSGSQVLSFDGHKDYVRCGAASPANSDFFATGSYDHTVKLWDSRVSTGGSVLEILHGNPVEDVVFLPSGGLIATAGGNSVKIWDVIGGGRLVYALESHNKTVTSICVGKFGNEVVEDEQNRLLSVSLDGYMKAFDYSALKVTHTMRYPMPLLSIAVSPDCSTRAIGTSNGVIYFGKGKKKEETLDSDAGGLMGFGSIEEPEKRVLRPTNYRYFQRGQNEKASEGDYVIKKAKKLKGAKHNKLLKKFRHGEALVAALNTTDPQEIVEVMYELVARRKLLKCVSNLDKDELGLLLRFLEKYSTMPTYSGFLLQLTNKVLQLRGGDVMDSDVLKKHVQNLKRSILEEIHIQQFLQEIQGIISPLLRIVAKR
ncbi:hypothetical protein Sjap_023573 [Stephania japonica]|uniref:U3 small nucleolar RNA-associated protein 15 C-terminal domain-containing protein n=1 Tax=Stephania japonica TaxID=461633 RepID=A0AAP0EBU7_9MAGN